MAAPSRPENSSLTAHLQRAGHEFDFFQAVRLLESIVRQQREQQPSDHGQNHDDNHNHNPAHDSSAAPAHDSRPDRAAVGRDNAPDQEAVRFRVHQSLNYPGAEVVSVRKDGPRRQSTNVDTHAAKSNRFLLEVAMMGLTGPQGVLPDHYTALVMDRLRHKDEAMRDLMDAFNHRSISLFYRAWEKYRIPAEYERAHVRDAVDVNVDLGGDLNVDTNVHRNIDALLPNDRRASASTNRAVDPFTAAVFALIGLSGTDTRAAIDIEPQTMVFYGGFFAHAPRNAVSLERMVNDYFGVDSRVCQFQGQWLQLRDTDRSRLPSRNEPAGRNGQLGVNTVAGQRVWSVDTRFRVELGPLCYDDYFAFTPAGRALAPLCELVRTYVGCDFDFDVKPILRAKDAPPCRLGGSPTDGARLGWNTFITTKPLDDDFAEAAFVIDALSPAE